MSTSTLIEIGGYDVDVWKARADRIGDAVSYIECHGFGVHVDFDQIVLDAANDLAEARVIR